MPSNRPDPSSPNAVASAGFATVRRGYDPDEVRELLRMVAAELARLQERERFLEAELRTAQRGTAPSSSVIDEEVVTRLLGEEAARVLTTAREGAAQIKARAEEATGRLLREATDEAQRLREEAEVEAARKRSDAQADAEAEIELAKQQGREMVNEAREYRERVLNELGRRREVARQQIEQLVHGRERLWAAFERARIAAVDVMSELQPLAEPAEFVNLAPTTGPVPLMVPAARLDPAAAAARPEPEPVADDAGEEVAAFEVAPGESQVVDVEAGPVELGADVVDAEADDLVADDLEAGRVEVTADAAEADGAEERVELPTDEVGQVDTDSAVYDDAADDEVFEMVATIDVVDADGVVEHFEVTRTMATESDADVSIDELHAAMADDDAGDNDDADDAVLPGHVDASAGDADAVHGELEATEDDRRPAPVVELFGEDRRPARPEGPRPTTRPSVDELFARLRASRATDVAQRATESSVAMVTSELAAAASNTEAAEATSSAAPGSPAPTPAAPADVPVRVIPPAAAAVPADDSVFRASPEAPAAVVLTDDSPFARRDEAITPIIVAAARRLKRVLADEQNDVLHTLRRAEPVRTVEALVSSVDEHVRRYASAIESDLLDAGLAGARSMGVDPADVRRAFAAGGVAGPARDVLATELIDPLRDRLDRAVRDVDGDNAELGNHVRGIYREWKTQRIDEQLDDVVRTAFGHGALAAAEPGSPVCWIVDPNGPACPDAEDNALAGVVHAGDPFPTDHRCAPAHSGCRCMIVPATS